MTPPDSIEPRPSYEELAEAVLAWDDEDNGRAYTSGFKTSFDLADLAQRLRAIGGGDA